MKGRRILLYILAGFVLLVVLAGAFLKIYLTDERLRAAIEPVLEEQLERDVSIEEFEFRLLRSFPNISIGAKNFAIHTPDDRPDLASVERLWIDMPLMPLLQSRIVVKELELETPRILVEVYEDLSSNLIEFSSDDDADAEESVVNEIDLQRIEVVDGEVGYVHADGTLMALSGLDGVVAARLTDLLSLSGSLQVEDTYYEMGGIPYADHWNVRLNIDSKAHLDSAWLDLESTLLSVEDLDLAIDGRVTDWDSDRIGIDLALGAPEATIQQIWSLLPASFTKDIEGLEGTGAIDFAATIKGFLAEEETPALDAHLGIENGSLKYPDLPTPIEGINLDAKISNDAMDIARMTAQASGASLQASGSIRNFASPTLDAGVNLNADLGAVSSFYPLEEETELSGRLSADTRLQGPINDPAQLLGNGLVTFENIRYTSSSLEQPLENLSGRARLDRNNATLENITLTSGASDFRFDGSLQNYGAWMVDDATETPFLTGRLTSKHLNVTEQLSQDTTSVGPIELPDLRMDIAITANELLYAPFSLSDAQSRLTLNEGVFGFDGAQAGFFEGILEGQGTFDLSDPMTPVFDGTMALNEVRASRFFSAFSSMDQIARLGAFLDGLFDSEATMSLSMDKDFNPALHTLIARGVFGAKQGILKEMPFQKKLAELTGVNALESLDIGSWTHAFNISGSQLNIQDLSFSAGEYQIALNGSQGFDGSMDYNFSLQLPESASAALSNAPIQGALRPVTQIVNTALVDPATDRISLDLTASGAFDSPNISLNDEMMRSRLQSRASLLADEARAEAQARLDSLENAARAKAQAELDKQRQAAEDRAKEAADDLIGGVIDSSGVATELDSLKEKGAGALKDRLKGLLKRKKN